jgi:hypothetical protein
MHQLRMSRSTRFADEHPPCLSRFFFSPPLCPEILYLPPPTYPSYLPPTNPTPPHSIAKAPETSSGCGAGAGAVAMEQKLERLELERDPRAHEKVRCLRFLYVFFICFV